MRGVLHGLFILLLVFLIACTPAVPSGQTQTTSGGQDYQPGADEARGELLVDAVTPYRVYTESEFNAAQESGKVIFLEFYADWCPYCRALDPQIRETFRTLNDSDVVAFRANYDKDVALKKQYNVVYQHTHIVLAPDGKIVYKALETDWNEEAIKNAITKAKGE